MIIVIGKPNNKDNNLNDCHGIIIDPKKILMEGEGICIDLHNRFFLQHKEIKVYKLNVDELFSSQSMTGLLMVAFNNGGTMKSGNKDNEYKSIIARFNFEANYYDDFLIFAQNIENDIDEYLFKPFDNSIFRIKK
ncbi:MAG: hypothetical protein US50_C0039G0016 [Candidatus Nomurabacteria bacterium GW2011_GWB1_37_5]|uniref:Uncharacterized protein n=1 Tax=Candidatus Nomurabacteria bacterium GW2011_GWB1_37_5 TaxID=1618742 RepID=A0A0G0H874_9BACT|nr:MAG: hypothetical protein US50_C0039G0016 [Candidatus Nomurabacteria bacterium GW2011_GWB1_37_5]